MYEISTTPHIFNDYISKETGNEDQKNSLIQKEIVLITSSDLEKVQLKYSCLGSSKRIMTWLKNGLMSNDSMPKTQDIELEYRGQSLSQQSEEVFSELQERLVPTVSSTFRLKGKKGLLLGAGVLASVTAGTLSYRHYFSNRPETTADVPLSTEVDTYNKDSEYISPYFHQLRSASLVSKSHLQHDDSNPTPFFRSDNRRQGIVDFLSKENILKNDLSGNEVKIEVLVAAVARYIYFQDNDAPSQQSGREEKVAASILSDNDLYGGTKGEMISPEFARSVIRHWLFRTVLSCSPEEYIAGKINSSSHPDYFSVSSLKYLLGLNYLFQDGSLNYHDIPSDQWSEFNSMWYFYLENEMPILKYSQKEIDNLSLSSQDFADLYSGSVFLDNKDNLAEYELHEVIKTGKSLWQMAISEDVNINNIGYFMFPALIITAINNHREKNENEKYLRTPMKSLEGYIKYRKTVMELQQDITRKFNRYKTAINNWASKGKIADDIIADCPTSELPLANYYAASLASPKQKREKAKQLYLNGIIKPCRNAPENLTEQYDKLTNEVASSFFEIDRLLVLSALSMADEKELEFILSSDSIIQKVNLSMRRNRPVGISNGPGVITDSWIDMKDTDLFAALLNNNERIYALKKIPDRSNYSYQLFRVDRNIRNYIDNGLLDNHFSKKYKVQDNMVFDGEVFVFNIVTRIPPIISPHSSNHSLADILAEEHRDKHYHSLYLQGDDKSDIQQLWHYAKHFIPFYDCVEAIVDGDMAQAIPACLMDIITLIPVSGQATSMGTKFAMTFAKGISQGGRTLARGTIKNAGTTMLREIRLPKVSELVALSQNTLRSVDPGFELVTRSGKFLTKKLDSFLRQQENGHLLAEKILSHRQLDKVSLTPEAYTSAYFPNSDIEVPVQKIATSQTDDIYSLVNPDNGNIFGKHYKIVSNRELKPIEGEIYKQNIRQRIYRMDQHEQSRLIEANNNRLLDITHLPVQRTFLSPYFYHPLHTQLSGVPYVRPEVQEHLAEDFTYMGVAIKNFIMESYHQNDIFYCRFNQRLEDIPEAFSQLRNNLQKYKEEVLLARKYVNALDYELTRTTMRNDIGELLFPPRGHRIEAYLSKVLQLDTLTDADIILTIKKEAMERLFFHTQKIKNYLNNEINNIYFVSCNTDIHPYVYTASCPMGFMFTTDNFRRIIIMVDNYQAAPTLSTQVHLTALHEVSHYSGTLDFQMAPSTSLVGDASEFMETFNDGIFGVNGESIEIKDTFIDAYRREHPDININQEQFRELLKRDPVLRANAFMENADFLARMIADLGGRTPYNSDILGHRKREAAFSLGDMAFLLYKLAIGNTKSITLNAPPSQ